MSLKPKRKPTRLFDLLSKDRLFQAVQEVEHEIQRCIFLWTPTITMILNDITVFIEMCRVSITKLDSL